MMKRTLVNSGQATAPLAFGGSVFAWTTSSKQHRSATRQSFALAPPEKKDGLTKMATVPIS